MTHIKKGHFALNFVESATFRAFFVKNTKHCTKIHDTNRVHGRERCTFRNPDNNNLFESKLKLFEEFSK